MQQYASHPGMIYTDTVSHLASVPVWPCRMSPDKQYCASTLAISERKGEGIYLHILSATGHSLSHRELTSAAAQKVRFHILLHGSYVGVWKQKWWEELATIGKRLVGLWRQNYPDLHGCLCCPVRTKQPAVQGSEEVHKTCLLCPQRLKQDTGLVLVLAAIPIGNRIGSYLFTVL